MRHKRFCGSPEDRFWAKVDKRGPDECWLWTGGVTRTGPHGYGRVFAGKGASPRQVVAHRLSWELANGRSVPEGMVVCHRCDVARCVNPAHLFIGTQADNMQDASRKGRVYAQTHEIPSGDAHPNTKVPDSLVLCMRMDVALGGMSINERAREYGFGTSHGWGLVSKGRKNLPTVTALRAPRSGG